MGEPLVVSGRGQITLPVALRKRLGLKGGDVVILEDRGRHADDGSDGGHGGHASGSPDGHHEPHAGPQPERP